MPLKTAVVRKPISVKKLARALGVPEPDLDNALNWGGVQVNGRRTRDGTRRLATGDRFSICYGETPPPDIFQPEWVVYEDEYLLVLNKPAGVTTQGTQCFDVNHLFDFAKRYRQGYVGLHHRLDRDTSGLVLFTCDRSVNGPVAALFRDRRIHKQYLAAVHGRMANPMTLDRPIGRLPGMQPARWWVDVPGGAEAITRVRPVVTGETISLIEAVPETGRTHQIRVHLAAAGHPVIGDTFYHPEEPHRTIRTLLHCATLSFPHPVTGDPVTVHAPIPGDMESFLERNGCAPV